MLTDLADVCRSSGLPVVEVEGWRTRGYAGQSLASARGVLWHHTATGRAAFARADCPTLDMLVNGRANLPGPLCNLALGRSGTVYVVAAGLANHAGEGSAPGIPVNTGNSYLLGIEMESSGVQPWDWTPEQIDAAPRLGAALERAYLSWLPESDRLQLGHYEYSSAGKIDPAGWPGGMDGLRASINQALAGINTASGGTKPIQEDDMANVTDEQLKLLLDGAAAAKATRDGIYYGGKDTPYEAPLKNLIDDIPRRVWDTSVERDGQYIPALQELADAKSAGLAALGQIAGLTEAIKQLAAGGGVDLAAITKAAELGVLNGLAGSEVVIKLPAKSEG